MDPWMKAVLSLAVAAASLYLILKKTDDGHAREIAMWLLGFVLGYWLR